jgi:two-component sensor histidine kinase
VGLPANFDVTKSKGLGMRLVTSFTQQLNGILDIHAANPGTEFVVRVPFLAAHG